MAVFDVLLFQTNFNFDCSDFANIYDGKCKLWSFDWNRAVEPVVQVSISLS